MENENIIGRTFGRWTVVGEAEKKNGQLYYQCRCECGTERAVSKESLTCGRSRSCGCTRKLSGAERIEYYGHKSEDLTGCVFGCLKVLGLTNSRKKQLYYRCQCICGKEKEVARYDLISGKVKSCGCQRKTRTGELKPLIPGQVFGSWTVLEAVGKRNGSFYYRCRCQCGKEKDVRKTLLTNGNSKSCGCEKVINMQATLDAKPRKKRGVRKERNPLYEDQQFGFWTIVCRDPERRDKSYYICRCVCGKKKSIQKSNLIHRLSTSCGCQRKVSEKDN